MQPKIRTSFLRSAIETLERIHGQGTLERLEQGVPRRLAPLLSLERLKGKGPLDALPLEEVEDALFSIDALLEDGAGRSMEAIATEVVSRALVNGNATASSGDLVGTLQRLRTQLEPAFINATCTFQLARTPSGFTLSIGVLGRPRATRLLRHFVTGALPVAARFAREPGTEQLRVTGESRVDRAVLTVSYHRELEAPKTGRPRQRFSGAPAAGAGRLSEQVERILAPALQRQQEEAALEPRPSRPSQRPSAPASERPPTTPSESERRTRS